jgi:hypothetical protein
MVPYASSPCPENRSDGITSERGLDDLMVACQIEDFRRSRSCTGASPEASGYLSRSRGEPRRPDLLQEALSSVHRSRRTYLPGRPVTPGRSRSQHVPAHAPENIARRSKHEDAFGDRVPISRAPGGREPGDARGGPSPRELAEGAGPALTTWGFSFGGRIAGIREVTARADAPRHQHAEKVAGRGEPARNGYDGR